MAEGEAQRVTDEPLLTRPADAFEKKYEGVFGFRVSDGRFAHEAGPADVYEVAPAKAFDYQRVEIGAATRFRFLTTQEVSV